MYEMDTDALQLAKRVVRLCELLSKGSYIIELTSAEPVNSILLCMDPFPTKSRDMSYYILRDIRCLYEMNLATLRVFSICSSALYPTVLTHTNLMDAASFFLCWGNYAGTMELAVRKKDYSESVLDELSLF